MLHQIIFIDFINGQILKMQFLLKVEGFYRVFDLSLIQIFQKWDWESLNILAIVKDVFSFVLIL